MAAIVLVVLAINDAVATDVFVGAGGGNDAAFADSGATSGTNGLTVRVGSFLSQSNETVSALGYNKLWVNNQISLLTASNGNVTTRTIGGVAGSFESDDITDALFDTTNSSFNSKRLWLLVSNDSTFTNSTQYALVTSTASDWTLPSDVTSISTRFVYSADITSAAFGSYSGLGSTNEVNMGVVPTDFLYWDSNGAAGLGGDGTWSTSTSDTAWTTDSSGVATDGPYAWGSTSGTTYYGGAGLTAGFRGTGGTVTVSGTVQAHSGLDFDPSSGSYTLSSGTINLAGGSAAANTITVASGDTAIIGSALTGSNGLTKAGAGTARLDGTNNYTGSTTINAGTLQANAANSLQSTNGITVNSGGSLLVSASDAVNSSATITLAGGTMAMSGSGITDAVGTLTLSANSIIDLVSASGARTLTFADSSGIDWIGTSLQIWNWNGTNKYGTSYGDADRKIFFGNSASGLTENQLGKISFYSGPGTGFIGNAFIRSTGEIAAIPEPEVYATAALLLLGLGIHFYRQHRCPYPASLVQNG